MGRFISADFRKWLANLDATAARWDKKCRNPLLSTQTGAEAWRWYFEEGYSVDDALLEYSNGG